MSRENVELFERALAALNQRDLEAFLALMDDGVEGVPRIAAMEGGYHGPEGIRRWWNGVLGVFPDLAFDLVEVRDLGDLTLAALRMRGRGAGSDTPVDDAIWQLAWWRHGRCTRWEIHDTEAGALGAVAPSE